ncbi:MAG: hypothetical protein AAGU27_02275 [Dehalobacterium sp.]
MKTYNIDSNLRSSTYFTTVHIKIQRVFHAGLSSGIFPGLDNVSLKKGRSTLPFFGIVGRLFYRQ